MASDKTGIKLALVVDDSAMQCKVLSVLLKEEGYLVVTANDGARGVAMYVKHKPDLVLMDINMPVMNGYEAARKIKSLSKKNSLCPLIFITSMDTDQAFIESIDAGGDGILVRPFSPEVFKAKIKSIQRISDLYSQIKSLQLEQQIDAELAEQLMSGVIESRNYGLDKIGIIKQPAALFSGDIQLSAICPNGDVNVLLGDFTGHGLRSSIGAIPLAETFRVMTKKGFSLLEVVAQVNNQLYNLLPPDLFLCATFVTISAHEGSAYIINAGLPEAYLFSEQGEIKHRFLSSHPPIGVLPKLLPDLKLKVIGVEATDRIILISDGIVEARNENGEMYDFERFEATAKVGVKAKSVCEIIANDVKSFCQNMPQEDDISLIDIPCGGWEQPVVSNIMPCTLSQAQVDELYSVGPPIWEWELSLTGQRLAKVNPIPIIMGQINEIEGSAEHWNNLYTILTELFVNALDHGVLGLGSELKSSPEGFVQYFTEREARLDELESGAINIKLSFFSFIDGGRMTISIKDSGTGFNIQEYRNVEDENIEEKMDTEIALSGRGISLVEQLCGSLLYKENGTLVEASYVWAS